MGERRRTRTWTVASLIWLVAVATLPACKPDRTAAAREVREDVYERYLQFGSLIRGGAVEPHWSADGHALWYVDHAPEHRGVFQVRPGSSGPTSVVDLAQLRAAIGETLGRQVAETDLPLDELRLVGDPWSAVEVSVGDAVMTVRLDTYQASRKVPDDTKPSGARVTRARPDEPPVVEVPSPDGAWYIGVRDHDLWLRNASGGEGSALTTDGVQGLEWVEKYLRNSTSWARWSPDSTRVAVKKVDSHSVARFPVVEWLPADPQVVWVRAPRSGGGLFQSELYVIEIPSGRRVHVDTGDEADAYLQVAGWLPDGSELLFLRADRLRKQLQLVAANPATGATRTIVEERSDTFVVGFEFNLVHNLTPVGDGTFAWLSQRDGWRHIYLYDLSGRLIRRLTHGKYPVIRVVAVSDDAKWIYFYAHSDPDRPYDRHLHRVPVAGGETIRLTEATGHHEVEFSPTREYFVDTHSTVARPPTVELRRADGERLHVLSRADISEARAVGWVAPEEFVATAADGETQLHGVLIKPFDFDPRRRYPVVEHIYGGPQVSIVPRTFHGHWSVDEYVYARALAQLGFIVFLVDGRGTPGRGKAFQDVVYERFGRHEIPDHVAVLEQLARERPYVDLSRVGVMGGSWGGYFATRALLLAPKTYHVAVADAPDVDLYDDGPFAYEAYMGMPDDNQAGYDYGSNLLRADALQGELLLVAGTRDPMVFAGTMKLVGALVAAGKPHDLIVLPEQPHDYSGAAAVFFRNAVRRYFVRHLRPYEER